MHQAKSSSMLQHAIKARDLGISVLALKHGTKKAAAKEWGCFQDRLATDDELHRDFSNGNEMAFAMGLASGNMEAIDFDEREFYVKWQEILWANGALLDTLVVEDTPRGGCHVVYRCAVAVDGNQKLAYKVTEDGEVKIAIETRGHGGYIKVAPSDGYRIVQLSWARIPTISAEAREMLLDAARDLDEYKASEPEGIDYTPPTPRQPYTGGEESPIERFNRTHSLASILEGAGWSYVRTVKGGRQQWIRPGKNIRDGISGTVTADGQMFICFTTSAPPFDAFERGKRGYYSAFAAHATIHHGGDFKAAAKAFVASEPRNGSARNAKTPAPDAPGSTDTDSGAEQVESPAPPWVNLGEVDPKETHWLHKPTIPRAAISMLQGDPGIGKSTVGLSIIAAASAGDPILGDGVELPPMKCLVVSLEDSIAEVIVPRLIASGANLSNIRAYQGEEITLDVGKLEEEIESWGADVVLLDPVVALVGADRDINKANETRQFMAQLAKVANRTGAAILLIHHMNKASGAKALYRSVGSIDFVAAVRSVMMAGSDPDNQDVRAVAHIKCNAAPCGRSWGYEIGEAGLAWTGPSKLTAERMSEMPEKRNVLAKVDDAMVYIEEMLKEGATLSDEIYEMGKEMGYSGATIKRAKAALGSKVRAEKISTEWQWRWMGHNEEVQTQK